MTSRPGFFDFHIHGISSKEASIDFMSCTPEKALEACSILRKTGIFAFTPTFLTSSLNDLMKACELWGSLILTLKSQFRKQTSVPYAIPLGIHLEGPFLNKSYRGAHEKKYLKDPDWGLFQELQNESHGQILILTVAPELKNALPFIQKVSQSGVRVQMGHSLASENEALQGAMAGATGLTHTFNAMRFHHRDTGLLAPLITLPHFSAEIITDGVHVSPLTVQWSLNAFPKKLYGVTDCCSGKTLGSVPIFKKGPVAYVSKSQTLAGGVLPLTRHPELLRKKLKDSKLFDLFEMPSCPVLKAQIRPFQHLQFRNKFDKNTYKLLESS